MFFETAIDAVRWAESQGVTMYVCRWRNGFWVTDKQIGEVFETVRP